MNVVAKPYDKWFFIKWSIALLLPALTYFFTLQSGLPLVQVKFYAITVSALCLWAMDLLPDALVASVLPVAYIVAQLGTPAQILSSWTTPVGWIVFAGATLGAVTIRTGFAQRVALWALYITRSNFAYSLWGILLAGIILAAFIPSAFAKAALFTVICVGICEALKLEKGSRAASAVMLAGLVAVSAPKNALLTGGADIALMARQLSQQLGRELTWSEFFYHNAAFALVYGIASIIVLLVVLRPKFQGNYTEYVVQEFKKLPPFSGAEKRLAVLFVIMLALFMTDDYHKVNACWVLMMITLVMALPGMNLLNAAMFNKLPFGVVFFVVGCMSIGTAAQVTGVDKSLAAMVAPHFAGASGMYGILVAYVTGAAVNFLLTPLAALAALTIPLSKIAIEAGANPLPIIYSFNYGLDQYIFPYEFAILLYFFATGWIAGKHLLYTFTVRFVVAGILLALVAYPWWKMCGILH